MLFTKSYSVILACLALFLVIVLPHGAQARMTAEERQMTKDASVAADKDIRFVDVNDIQTKIANGVSVLFFGAQWCIFTQRFTPKWLEVQKLVDEKKYTEKSFTMAKIDCTDTTANRGVLGECTSDYNIEAFPTMNLYINGEFIEEYPLSDEVEPLFEYIKRIVTEYNSSVPPKSFMEELEGANEKIVSTKSSNDKPSFIVPSVLGLLVIGSAATYIIVKNKRRRSYNRI